MSISSTLPPPGASARPPSKICPISWSPSAPESATPPPLPTLRPASASRRGEPVEHLGADHARVEHMRALGDQALAAARAELRRRVPHVAPQPDPQVAGRL